MKKFLLFFLVGLGLVACQSENKSTNSGTKESTAPKMEYFGAKITPDGAISFEDLLKKMESTDSLQIKVQGKVADVCQKKGCWMTLADQGGNEMIVQFADYGFFVPKDCGGKTAVLEGYAYREVTPVEHLRHIAKDAGQSDEEIAAITEPLEELKFMATGVILKDE